jgi:hypothetical protein
LFDLLCLHPDCAAPSTNWEDFLVDKSDLLVGYVNSVFSGWRRRGTPQEIEDLFYEHLGNGLISVLASRVKKKRVLTKTPSVRNLNNFFRLFPRAYLLILVRDGRAVVESRVKSFNESYETAMRLWAEGADTILRFQKGPAGSQQRYLIVRYEDLWNEPERELRRIFAFSGLEPEKYDFSAGSNLPVRGSSVFHGQEKKEVHWKPVAKTPDFNPLSRSNNWTRSMHEQFNSIAGHQQAQLGYQVYKLKGNEVLWAIRNRVMDIKWHLKRSIRSVGSLMKTIVKWLLGVDRLSRYRRQVMAMRRTLSNSIHL